MFSGMTDMLPMGVGAGASGAGMPRGAGYGYGHWGSMVGGASGGPYPGYPGMPGTSVYDGLGPVGSPKPYKEGGASVKFDTFDGAKDKKNAMMFLQQFDAAFVGGNFTEISKIR